MLRFAMCNEPFGQASFASTCASIREAGYTGIEIAPFTLSDMPSGVSAVQRRELRNTMADCGLDFVGLHWLMVRPPGLHVTTSDEALRRRSWAHVHELIDLCGDLASGPSVMVFGSPKQRGSLPGTTPAEATERLTEGLAQAASHAESRGVTILIEPLPHDQCDVVRTLGEAAVVVNAIGSPAIQTMFDTHNTIDETETLTELLRKYIGLIRHVHVNELDGRYPGTGDYDFRSLLRTLETLHYRSWVSLEVFDFEPNPSVIARESLGFLQSSYLQAQ